MLNILIFILVFFVLLVCAYLLIQQIRFVQMKQRHQDDAVFQSKLAQYEKRVMGRNFRGMLLMNILLGLSLLFCVTSLFSLENTIKLDHKRIDAIQEKLNEKTKTTAKTTEAKEKAKTTSRSKAKEGSTTNKGQTNENSKKENSTSKQ